MVLEFLVVFNKLVDKTFWYVCNPYSILGKDNLKRFLKECLWSNWFNNLEKSKELILKLCLNWILLDLNVFSVFFISSHENKSKSILFCLCILANLLFNKQKLKIMVKTLEVGINSLFIQTEIPTFQTLQTNQLCCIFFSLYFSTFLGWMVERTFWCHTEFKMIIDEKFLIHAWYFRDSTVKRVITLRWFINVCQIIYQKVNAKDK